MRGNPRLKMAGGAMDVLKLRNKASGPGASRSPAVASTLEAEVERYFRQVYKGDDDIFVYWMVCSSNV